MYAIRSYYDNIINISYNYLNLPEKIDKEGGTRLEYLYDAAGNKLRQLEYKEGILRKTTDFVANFVFINGKPAWYNFDEGRVVYKSEANYYAESYLKDHTSTPLSTGLGSVRVAFGYENGTFITRQVNSYYPFGMNIKGLTVITSYSIHYTKLYECAVFITKGHTNTAQTCTERSRSVVF